MAQEQIAKPTQLIVIGGSSGSLDALMVILPLIKPDLAIPIVMTLHRSTAIDNGLAMVMSNRTRLQVKEADEKEVLLPGWIYIAPPDYHLLLEADGTISLDVSEKVNYCRPSIDVTFISAANAYKKGLTAILLSGANADGAAGMIAIHECEGKNIVQHPAESQVSYMPEQAIITGVVDEILPVTEIATFINHL